MSTVIVLHPHRMARAAQAHRPAPANRSARPAGRPGLRLTRRGHQLVRVAVTTAVVLVVLAAVLLLSRSAQAGSQVRPVPMSYHVVLPGETLWQIAGEVAPAVDRRETVAQLVELNALDGAQLSVGQRIAVPVRTARG